MSTMKERKSTFDKWNYEKEENRRLFDEEQKLLDQENTCRFECRLAKFERNGNTLEKKLYRCDQVKLLKDFWLKKFRKQNNTEEIESEGKVDFSYKSFKCQIDSFLNNCKCGQSNER